MPVGLLHAEKMEKVVLLNVLMIGFSGSPFKLGELIRCPHEGTLITEKTRYFVWSNVAFKVWNPCCTFYKTINQGAFMK